MFSAIVLAGGKSRRMGKDKRQILFQDKPLLHHAVHSLVNLSDDIVISANDQPELDIPCRYIPDISSDLGPLGGLYSSLMHIKYSSAIVITCDMPNINQQLIAQLISNYSKDSILVFGKEGRIQPFPGIYPKNLTDGIKSMLDKGDRSMKQLLTAFNAQIHTPGQEGSHNIFLNINSPEDLNISGK